jgi:hypothetical protein
VRDSFTKLWPRRQRLPKRQRKKTQNALSYALPLSTASPDDLRQETKANKKKTIRRKRAPFKPSVEKGLFNHGFEWDTLARSLSRSFVAHCMLYFFRLQDGPPAAFLGMYTPSWLISGS